jgi:cell division protein FtsI (penicillin-binding protein 3)
VLDGTAKRSQLNGYTSAGKTGTAWKYDEKLKRVNSAKYISSFMGFAPAEDPRVTIAVVIDEPKIGGRDGGHVAAPAFREIAETVLPELGVEPKGVSDRSVANDEEIPEESIGSGTEVANDKTVPSETTVAENDAEKPKAKPETKKELKTPEKPEAEKPKKIASKLKGKT